MKIKDLIPGYLKHLQAIGRSPKTLSGRKYDLNEFIKFLDQEKAFSLDDLTGDIMAEYQQELSHRLTAKRQLLALRTQAHLMSVATGFTKYLKDKDYLLNDPGAKIKLPKKPKRLPKVILKPLEIKRLMNAPDVRTNPGYRDRIILEVLYDTAIRRSEISAIKLTDMDLESGFIHIHGKGNKDRVVPLSKRVCELVRNYILMIRPLFLKGKDDGHLILNRWGKGMDGNGIWSVVKRYSRDAGLQRSVTTHTMRHTCVTHMLKNGAPVRHLQEMLGHESLESTQLYTHITINDLKEVHARYHPGDTLDNTCE